MPRLRSLSLASLTTLLACVVAPGDDAPRDEAEVRAAHATVLPNWATAEEAAIERAAAAPMTTERSGEGVAPVAGYRVPAEYEPVTTVVMTYAGHPDVLSGISVAAAAAGANVWMVGGPASIAGVPPAKYKAIAIAYDSIWTRDYGPFGIDESTHALGIIDTTYRHYAARRNDDAMSCRLATLLGAPCHTTSLILDGGNYMTDGHGNMFMSKRVYEWNSSISKSQVDALLKQYMGAKTITAVDYAASSPGTPADGTGHIDMFAKLVADCKVIVAQTSDEPYKTQTESVARVFASTNCSAGHPYEVTRVKGWVKNGVWYTYSNSLIVNHAVIMPFYANAANDEAKAAYQAALPGFTITGVASDATIVEGGSIHCITKEIPVAN